MSPTLDIMLRLALRGPRLIDAARKNDLHGVTVSWSELRALLVAARDLGLLDVDKTFARVQEIGQALASRLQPTAFAFIGAEIGALISDRSRTTDEADRRSLVPALQ